MTGAAVRDASDDVARFMLLASAIAGRWVDVAPARPGEATWTDGATVFVDTSGDSAERLRCVAVQAALLGAGSFHGDVLRALTRRAALGRRYLAVEGHRALAAQEDLLPAAARGLLDPSVAARSESAATSLALAMSRAAVVDPPQCFGVIRPREFRRLVDADGDWNPGEHVPRQIHGNRTGEYDGVDDDRDSDGSAGDLSSPVGGGGAIGRLLKRMLGDARSRNGGPPGTDAPTHWTRRSSRVSRHAGATTATFAVMEDAGDVRRCGHTYPEWDGNRRRYRPDWCTVTEIAPDLGDLPSFETTGTSALRRPLARLGVDVERRRRQRQGNDIDIDAAVDASVQMRAGTTADEATYIDDVRRRRDLSVLVLLDISGSAGEPSAAGIAVHDLQRASAARLTAALHDLGDRVALYAFRSMGRAAVHVAPVKRFDEAFGPLALRRLGALDAGAYTRLGAAIRHGSAVLEDGGGTGRRLLVVLSDGFAYDHGYEGPYAEADARRALAEARRRGMGCVCVSVGASTDVDALRRVFGTAAHANVPRVEQLPGIVGPLFRAALRSAEARRRTWQRSERTRERALTERRTG